MSNKATKAKQIQQLENELQDNEIVMAFSAFRWVTPELHKLRKQLREYNSTIYLGKKSLLEVAAKRVFPETSWEYKAIRKLAKGTAAILFVRSEATLLQIINVIRSLTITLPISKGMTVPTKVIIPKGPTNLEPTQTSWFRCYGIASKISRGKIETIYDTVLCEAGTIVEEPQAMLCKLFNVSLSIHYDIDCIVHLKDLYEFPSYIISYSLENAEKTLRTGAMNIRALESILSQQEEDSSLVCEENIGEVRRCPFSQKENLSEWLAGYEENITTERFQLIKENTHCLFAKRATVWGNKRRWDAGVSLEENCKAIYPEIEEFLGCSEFLKLDGFVLEIGEADKYATTEKQFEETFLSMVELWILENGGNLSDECKAGFYNIAGVLCFLTCFAPCYPASSSRFMFTEESTKNSCFILIQPESSFIRHNLFDPQNPRTSLAQNPPKVCKLIRDNFANHGRPYLKV